MISIGNNSLQLKLQHYLRKDTAIQTNTMEKLSSGKRLNRASDDAANLSVSVRMNSQIKGNTVGNRNVKDGISLLQSAEGALQSIANMLQRMRELTLQANNGTYSAKDRTALQQEVEQLKREIDKVAMNTTFNGKNLLGPSIEDIKNSSAIADIVFVIDNTGSMSSIQQKIANNLGSFAQQLKNLGIQNVRFGVMEYTNDENNVSLFPSGQWTANPQEVADEVNRLATLNRGGTENVMTALTTVANTYVFREKPDNTVAHAILITDENADDGSLTNATLTLMKDKDIEVHGVYNAGFSEGTPKINQIIHETGGMGLDIQSENWGEQLNALLAPKITASATKDVSFDQTIRLHTGYEADDVFEFDLNDNRTISLGVADINIATSVDKGSQIEKIDAALEKVSTQLATFGAYINRLNLKEANNETSITTTTKSVSKLVDADMAQEMSLLVKTNVLQQAIVASMQQMQKSFSQSMQTLLTK